MGLGEGGQAKALLCGLAGAAIHKNMVAEKRKYSNVIC
jgi:hypothetical protein